MANGNWWDKYKTGGAAVAVEESSEPEGGNWWDKYRETPAITPEPEEEEEVAAEQPQENWWDKYKEFRPTEPQEDPNKKLLSDWDATTQDFTEKRKTYEQLGAKYQELGSLEARTPEQEKELQDTWNSLLNTGFSLQTSQEKVAQLQPEIDQYNERQRQARIDYIEDRRGSGIFGDEGANALYELDARAEQEYEAARSIEDDQKRKEAIAAIQAKYQTEEKTLNNQFIERFKESETKINNAADVIGQAFASGQTVDQFLLETNAGAEEYDELRSSLINQDDPEKGRLYRESKAMYDLAVGQRVEDGETIPARVGIVNNEIRVSPLHVWDAEGIKAEIEALDISEAKKQKTIASIPQLQEEAAKVELPFLQQVKEFNNFVKDNNLENVSPKRQIAEWKSREEDWLDYIGKAPAQVGIGLTTGTLGLLEAGQAIVGATALTMGAQNFADPFLDAATKTSDEVQRLTRISQEIGGPTFAAELAAVVPQIVTQIGFGGAVAFGGRKVGLKPKTVSNIGFGSSVGVAFAQSYGGVLSSAFQQLEKEKIDGGMNPTQARAEAVKEAQLPAALSGLSTAIVTTLGGKRGAEAVFRQGANGIKAKLNTAAFRAELDAFIPNVVKGFRNEGYEEFADQLAQGIIEQFSFNPELATSDIINNAFKALVIGGVTGGTVEGLKYGYDYMRAPSQMARREASMASMRQSISDVEKEISEAAASSPIGAKFQREYDVTQPSDEAAALGARSVDRTRMTALQEERKQLTELLEDETISRVARNQLEAKLAAADFEYYSEILVPSRINVTNEQIVDQLDAMAVTQKTKDSVTALAKIANGLGAESLTGRERVAVGITSIGEGRFIASRKNPMIEVTDQGVAKVTEAGRLMAENIGMVPLVRMIGLSETTKAKRAEMQRMAEQVAAQKAQTEAKEAAESDEAKRYGPESAEALKRQAEAQPPAGDKDAQARMAQLLREQEEAKRLGEEAVAKAMEGKFLESFRPALSEFLIPTAERAATVDLDNFREALDSIATFIDEGKFTINVLDESQFKVILPESAYEVVVEAFKQNPQRALNALRAFGDEVENAIKEFGGGAAGAMEEPPEVASLRRVARSEQTPEDVKALSDAGLVEIYKDQPVITEAGIAALPEAERPRLSPEARKIQIDTGANEVVAEAISKNLRIGVDQVGPNVKMPEGWTLDGDIYVPPQKQEVVKAEEPPVAPPVAGALTEEQANQAVKDAQEARAKGKPVDVKGRTAYGPQSVSPKLVIGKTAREALLTVSRINLSKIAKSNPNEIMMQDIAAILAELNMPILDAEKVITLSSIGRKGRARRVKLSDGTTAIAMPSTLKGSVRLFAHEIGHTITADEIGKYAPRKKTGRGKDYLDALNKAIADPKTPDPVKRLFTLYISTIDQLGITEQYFGAKGIAGTPDADESTAMAKRMQATGALRKDLDYDARYGLANVEEFVSQTFSRPTFRELLKTLKDPTQPSRTLWSAFVEAIQRILQLPKGSMAAGVIEASVDIGMITVPSRAAGRVAPTPITENMAYAGEQANIPQFMRDSLSVAQAMAAKKTDPETIRNVTGWIVNPYDGKLRWEIPDNNAKFTNAWDNLVESPVIGTPVVARLGDILSHPQLFKAYPDIADVTIVKRSPFLDFFKSTQGSFNDKTNQIIITPYAVDPLSTMLHEIQHWIQNRENFARGSNTQKAMEILTPNQRASIIAEMNTKADDMARFLREELNKAWELRDHLRGIQAAPEKVAAFDLAVQERQRADAEWDKARKSIPLGDPARNAIYDASSAAKKKLWQAAGIDPKNALATWDIAYPVLQAQSFDQILKKAEEDFAKLEKDISSPYEIIADASKGDKEFKAALDKFGLSNELYRRVAGEIEARDVQSRAGMTPEERAASEPYSSQNIAPELAIVTFTSPSETTEEVNMAPEGEPEEGAQTIQMQFESNDERLQQIFARRMYDADLPDVVNKETVQNSFDAIKDAEEMGEIPAGEGLILFSQKDIKVDGQDRVRVTFIDNGAGMTPEILQNAFFTVGGTFKRSKKASGGFGIAKLGMFMSAEKVYVETVRDGVVTSADVDKKFFSSSQGKKQSFPVEITKDPSRKNGTMVVLDFEKTFTKEDGKTVEYKKGDINFKNIIKHKLTIYEDAPSYNTAGGANLDLFVDYFRGKNTREELDKEMTFDVDVQKMVTFEDIEKNLPEIETFEQEFNVPNATKPIKVKIVASRLGLKKEDGTRKQIDAIDINGSFMSFWNAQMSVYSNGLFQFSEGTMWDPLLLNPKDKDKGMLPYAIFVDIDAAGIDAARIEYPFKNNREGLRDGEVEEYVSMTLDRLRIKENNRQFDQTFAAVTDLDGNKPRKDAPVLYNNTTLVLSEDESKFVKELSQEVFDIAEIIVQDLRRGNEMGMLPDAWYKVKTINPAFKERTDTKEGEDSLQYFYGVGISKNWSGVNTSREPVSALVNPLYDPQVETWLKSDENMRYYAMDILKTLIHEINHHLHRNEGGDFTYGLATNEGYLTVTDKMRLAAERILPIIQKYKNIIPELKNKFDQSKIKDAENELSKTERSIPARKPNERTYSSVVGDPRVVQEPSGEVSRPTAGTGITEGVGADVSSRNPDEQRGDIAAGEVIPFGKVVAKAATDLGTVATEEAFVVWEDLSPEVRESRREPAPLTQQDREYLDAVERGDLDAAQRLVDEAAKAAGYGTRVWHSSTGQVWTKTKDSPIYLSREKEIAEWATQVRAKPFYTNLTPEEIKRVPKWSISKRGGQEQIAQGLLAEGMAAAEGIMYPLTGKKQTEILMARPSGRIKSADAVTRDDQGNIIPPSQRFQPTEEDIRYAPDEEFEIIPERVEDQIEGTPEASTIKVMGEAFNMANEQSNAEGTPEGTLPLQTITNAWMNSGRDVKTLKNAIIRYTNLSPEVAATLAQAISKQLKIQRGIAEVSNMASRKKEKEPEYRPFSFGKRIADELPAYMRNKMDKAYEVLRNDVSIEEANRVMQSMTVEEAMLATMKMDNGVPMAVRSMMAQITLRKIMDKRVSTKGKRQDEYRATVAAHVDFIDWINEYLMEMGQGIQAFSKFSDLGADGILLKVRKDIGKAIDKHITNRKKDIDKIKRDVEDGDSAAFDATLKANKSNIEKAADNAAKGEAKKLTIEEQAQKLAQRAAQRVAGEVRRRQPDPLSDLVNGHLRKYNANFIAEAQALGVSPVTAQKIEESAIKLRDARVAAKSERERFKAMQEERMKVKRELARENKYIYGYRQTIWEDYQDVFSERLARRLMRDPKKKIPPSLLLFTDRLTENLLGFVPEAERQASTPKSFQAMIEDALNNKERYQEAFNRALEDISLKIGELEVRMETGEKLGDQYKKALAAQEFLERLAPQIQDFPVSDKLVMRFVGQKTKAANVSIVAKYNEWYRASRTQRKKLEQELAEGLVSDVNISNADAVKLARAIVKDFVAKAEERREKALARFKKPKEKSKRLAQSPLKKFFELVNMGAMTDQEAYEVMAHRFELPTWDEKFAETIENMALELQDMPEGNARRKMTQNLMAEIARRKGFSLADLGAGFAYSNMLSDFETFLINLNDTLINNFTNAFANSVGDGDWSRMTGLVRGYRKGWREAVYTFKTGLRINMPRLEEKTPLAVELVKYGRKGGVPLESTEGANALAKTILESYPARFLNLWRYVTRIMEATDAFNYTASAEGQRYAEAAKMAKDEGLKGKARDKRINEILNLGDDKYQAALKQAEQEGYTGPDAKLRAIEIQDSAIEPEMRERSFERALTDVYRNMPKGMAGMMAGEFHKFIMRWKNPWVRNALKLITAPFVITPTNLFNKWLDWSPYGYKRLFWGSGNFLDKDGPYYLAPPKVGSSDFYAQAFKASSSVLVMGLVGGLIKAGLLELIGRGPSDEEERKQWLDDGNKPYTFRFMNGPAISFAYTPWALMLSAMANISNWEKYNKKEDSTLADRSYLAFLETVGVVMELPFFSGPADLIDALIVKSNQSLYSASSRFVESKYAMLFPNLVRKIDNIFDPTIYDSQGIRGLILDKVPFARRFGNQRLNMFGEPIGEGKPVIDRFIGRTIVTEKPSRESRILAKYDAYPYMPNPRQAEALVDGEKAQMTEEQYNEFARGVGQEFKKWLNSNYDPDAEVSDQALERGKKRISKRLSEIRARWVRKVSTY